MSGIATTRWWERVAWPRAGLRRVWPAGLSLRMKLHRWILLIVVVAPMPGLIGAGIVTSTALERFRSDYRDGLRDLARMTALAVDREIEASSLPPPDRIALILEGARQVRPNAAMVIAETTSAPAWLAAPASADPPWWVGGAWTDGVQRLCAVAQPARAPSWRVGACVPAAEYAALLWQPVLVRLGGLFSAALCAWLCVWGLTRWLMRPIAAITAHANGIADGQARPPAPPPGVVTEFEALRIGLRRAEAELRRQTASARSALAEARDGAELLRSVIDGTADGINVKDLDLRYVLTNHVSRRQLKLPAREEAAVGMRAEDVLPAEQARGLERVERAVIATGTTREFEVSVPDGIEVRHYRVTKAPWRDAEGRLAGVVSVSRDITQAKATETRLRRQQAGLLRATRLSALGAMAGGLAHEVNQPLTAATNFLTVSVRMLDQATAGDTAARARLAGARAAAADAAAQLLRAGAIVRQLRGFVLRGEAELQMEDVADLIAEACELARADGAVAGIALDTALAPALGQACIDRTQLQQVLLNLIRNAAEAIRATPLAVPAAILVVAARTANGAVEITVADTGPGLAPEIRDSLFEPFTSTKPDGMGIGLPICRSIVEGHGGTLETVATGGDGTVFRIRLPPILLERDTAPPLRAQGAVHA